MTGRGSCLPVREVWHQMQHRLEVGLRCFGGARVPRVLALILKIRLSELVSFSPWVGHLNGIYHRKYLIVFQGAKMQMEGSLGVRIS